MADEQCALWFWRHYSLDFDLYDTEEEAARAAVAMEDNGDANVQGVQFRDGRCLDRDNWPAYEQAESRIRQEEKEWAARYAAEPARPTREIRDPFKRREVLTVDEDTPGWVGWRQTERPPAVRRKEGTDDVAHGGPGPDLNRWHNR